MNKPFIIGISGISRSGKNTFCDLVCKTLNEKYQKLTAQMSFAHQLRLETANFLSQRFSFDVWSDKDKSKFRPFLVWYANLKREESKGRYFIDKFKEKVKVFEGTNHIIFINDLRFKQFEYDELDYVKEHGVLVHVSKYKITGHLQDDLGNPVKVFDDPPNEFEAKNDPIIKAAADYKLEWIDVGKDNLDKLQPYIDNFVSWLSEKGHLKC